VVEDVAADDGLGGIAAEAAAEDAQWRERLLILPVEQLVAPLDRRTKRPVPVRGDPVRGLQGVQPAAEPRKDRTRREQRRPRRSKLEGE
jgi:hypothetical protein